MKKVIAIQDESSHWYVIPAESKSEFNELIERFMNTDDYDILSEFETKFDKYRTGGDLNNVQLYAEI